MTKDPVPRKFDLLIGVAKMWDAIKSATPINEVPGMFDVETVYGPCLTSETDKLQAGGAQVLLSNAAL